MRLRTSIAAGLALAFVAGAPARGQIFRYMAFGDSITKGRDDFDPTGQGGYPGRIDDLLGCFAPNCEVINEGKDGERTPAGVTRIETLLDQEPWDVVLLMEGSNDVFRNFSNDSIEANLTLMDTKARDHGVDTLHASIIHLDPQSEGGMDPAKVAAVADLRNRVIALAAARNRYFADPWTPLCPDQACFNANYHNPGPGDPNTVGHPNPSGFDIMAGVFANAISGAPVPGPPSAVAPVGTVGISNPAFVWDQESPQDANWYELRVVDAGQVVVFDEWKEEGAVCAAGQCTSTAGALADGDYTWEVRGRDPLGRSVWISTPFTISTAVPPGLPTLLGPSGFTADVEPTFTWTRETPSLATTYRLEVSNGGGVVLDTTLAVGTVCVLADCSSDPFAGAPLAPDAYSWRLQGSNAVGDGPWTDPLVFEVEPNLIFWDGFESGDLGAWASSQP